jgi:Zn-dependent peptidase ImmA (M78 family)
MDRIKKKPNFLSFEKTNEIVKTFLKEHSYKNEIPVPIENIIEALGFDIIPSFQLNYRLGIEGFIIPKMKEIYIDKDILEYHSPNRYYSTLAHEVGHLQLHMNYMSEFSSLEDYISFLENFNKEWSDWIEAQAWNFARLLLLPSIIFPEKYRMIKKSLKLLRILN